MIDPKTDYIGAMMHRDYETAVRIACVRIGEFLDLWSAAVTSKDKDKFSLLIQQWETRREEAFRHCGVRGKLIRDK